MMTDDYGTVTEAMFRKLKRLKVTPAEWDTITDAFELIADADVDESMAKRWLDRNTEAGQYREPWPLNPVDIVTA